MAEALASEQIDKFKFSNLVPNLTKHGN